MFYLIRRVLAKPRLILDEMCRLCGKFASYLRRVLCKARLIFPRINGPSVFLVIFFKAMYNKTIITFGFCDILNNQGISFIIPDITKTSSTIFCFFFSHAARPSDQIQTKLHFTQFNSKTIDLRNDWYRLDREWSSLFPWSHEGERESKIMPANYKWLTGGDLGVEWGKRIALLLTRAVHLLRL